MTIPVDLNTRRTIDYIKKSIIDRLKSLYDNSYKVSNEIIKVEIDEILKELEMRKVLYKYDIDCFDKYQDRSVYAVVNLQLIKTMEHVTLNFNIEDSIESIEALVEAMNIIVENKSVNIN